MVHGIDGWFRRNGYRNGSVGILLAHHTLLRTGELFELRKGDVTFVAKTAHLVLRDTKIGQRYGVLQEVACTDPWLTSQLVAVVAGTPDGNCVLGLKPAKFRKLWRDACKACGIPGKYTPYSMRRGGATCLFMHSSSFDVVAEVGRWANIRTVRLYVNQALLELSSQPDQLRLCRHFAKHLHV